MGVVQLVPETLVFAITAGDNTLVSSAEHEHQDSKGVRRDPA